MAALLRFGATDLPEAHQARPLRRVAVVELSIPAVAVNDEARCGAVLQMTF